MKKIAALIICCLLCAALMFGCAQQITQQSEGCYAAAIMVDGTVYYQEFGPMPGEVDPSAIIGYTTRVVDAFPEKEGEANFGTDNMPYARVQEGIAVLYENEWYLCTLDK